MLSIILQSLWFFLPIGAANMTPVISKNILKFWAVPVSEKWLGSHKTWRGFILGILAGELVYLIQWYGNWEALSLFNYQDYPWWAGFLLGFGALFGDAVKSFIKRRLGKKPGAIWFPWDQIDYTVMGLLLGTIIFPIGWETWAVVIILGLGLHIFTNNIAFWLKLKDTRW